MLRVMNTLAFDTSFGACSAAATWRAGERLGAAARFERLERGHAERLLPMIAEVMAEAPFGFDALERIVVTSGPGTFTGQRVGIAAARALRLATGAEVATLSSLAVMAYTAAAALGEEAQGRVLAVAVDARRGELYFQDFAGPDLAPRRTPVLTTAEDAARRLAAEPTLAVGSGAAALALAAGALGLAVAVRLATLEPDVRFIPDGAGTVAAAPPTPLYLRPPDAKPQDGARLARVP